MILVHVPDVAAMEAELDQLMAIPSVAPVLPYSTDSGWTFHGHTGTVQSADGNSRLALIADLTPVQREALIAAQTITVLAEGDDPIGDILALPADDPRLVAYRSVWPATWSYTDELGQTVTVANPGRFVDPTGAAERRAALAAEATGEVAI